jgi:hypothetical protein
MLAACAAALAATAQREARAPRDLVVSSLLERVGATGSGHVEESEQATDAPVQADQLIVSVRFENASGRILDSIRITSPIPADLSYVAGSASGPGADVLFSVDNGLSFGRPEELTLPASDGGLRAADPADYTHVRWVLHASLDAGASGVARFRAVPR